MSAFGRNPETEVSESIFAGAARQPELSSKANQKVIFSKWQLQPIVIRTGHASSLMLANNALVSTFYAYNVPADIYTSTLVHSINSALHAASP
jgi:hypothetical protein